MSLPAAQRSLKMKEIISHVAVIERDKLRGKDVVKHSPKLLNLEELELLITKTK